MSSCADAVRCRAALLAIAALCAMQPALAAQSSGNDSARAGHAELTPLFASDSVIAITIATDLKTFMRDRRSTEWRPATLAVAGDEGTLDTLEVRVRSRGHFRREAAHCDFPPVQVDFRKGTKKTPFAKQKALKLVTPCRVRKAEYEHYIVEEYYLYRIYNLFTPVSFRARLVRVTYEDSKHAVEPITSYAFFVEDDDDMAARNGGEIMKAPHASRRDLVPSDAANLGLFQYMIGNTDWSIGALHNIRLVLMHKMDTVVTAVPYDFDWSGVIAPPYARPDYRLPIHDVRDPLYRGFCTTPDSLAPAIARFNERKDAIFALYRAPGPLDAERAAKSIAYFEKFYRTINDPRKLRDELTRSCLD